MWKVFNFLGWTKQGLRIVRRLVRFQVSSDKAGAHGPHEPSVRLVGPSGHWLIDPAPISCLAPRIWPPGRLSRIVASGTVLLLPHLTLPNRARDPVLVSAFRLGQWKTRSASRKSQSALTAQTTHLVKLWSDARPCLVPKKFCQKI